MAELEFWYEFASPYSYFAAERIGPMAEAAGVTVHWRPVFVGPIFRAMGHDTSPVVDNPQKWAYLKRDVVRQAARHGLPIAPRGEGGPVVSMLGTRVALLLAREEGDTGGPVAEFSKALYRASFVDQQAIGEPSVVAGVLSAIGMDDEAVIARALTPENKEALKAQVAEAQEKGLFGIPTFFVADDLFWGDDRLEQAMEAASHA